MISPFTMANGRMAHKMEQVLSNTQMAHNTKVNGQMVKNLDLAGISMQMVECLKESSIKTKNMVQEP